MYGGLEKCVVIVECVCMCVCVCLSRVCDVWSGGCVVVSVLCGSAKVWWQVL